MPLTSVESAEAWTHANRQRAPRCNIGAAVALEKVGGLSLIGRSAPANSLEKILQDVHKARDSTYAILDAAIKKGDAIPIATAAKNHSDAIGATMRTEDWVMETLKERGQLISIDAARALINRTLAPIQAALDGFPAANSQRCNPSQPLLAETALREAIDDIKTQVHAALLSTVPPA